MAYAKTQLGAKKRVKLKRELRRLGVTGWKKEDPTYKLKAKLSKKKK